MLPIVVLDHYRVLVLSSPFKGGPSLVRFENMWLEHQSLKKFFEEWWSTSRSTCHGWEGFKFTRKLKMTLRKN